MKKIKTMLICAMTAGMIAMLAPDDDRKAIFKEKLIRFGADPKEFTLDLQARGEHESMSIDMKWCTIFLEMSVKLPEDCRNNLIDRILDLFGEMMKDGPDHEYKSKKILKTIFKPNGQCRTEIEPFLVQLDHFGLLINQGDHTPKMLCTGIKNCHDAVINQYTLILHHAINDIIRILQHNQREAIVPEIWEIVD